MKSLRNKLGVWLAFCGLMLMAGCTGSDLPDPTVKYPTPPAALMEPSRDMKAIPN